MSIPAPGRRPPHTYQKLPSSPSGVKPPSINASRFFPTFKNLGKKVGNTHKIKRILNPRGSDVTMEDIFFGKRRS